MGTGLYICKFLAILPGPGLGELALLPFGTGKRRNGPNESEGKQEGGREWEKRGIRDGKRDEGKEKERAGESGKENESGRERQKQRQRETERVEEQTTGRTRGRHRAPVICLLCAAVCRAGAGIMRSSKRPIRDASLLVSNANVRLNIIAVLASWKAPFFPVAFSFPCF